MNKQVSEDKKTIDDTLKNIDVYAKGQEVQAKLCRAYYKALIKEGFTEDQAVSICAGRSLL